MKIKNVFTSIDTHTGGEPTRTITGGVPYIPGDTIAQKMLYLKENMDWIRTSLMFEPRGHSVMSGVILTEPKHPDADVGAIFIETGGYLPMCGHDTIGVATAMVETGMVVVTEPETFINLDTPAGVTRVKVRVENGRAKEVTFLGVPSFVFEQDIEVEVPGIGRLVLDIAYGGNVYAILPAANVGLEIKPNNASALIEKGRIIKHAINRQVKLQHPEFEFINKCTHVEFYGAPTSPEAHLQNAVVLSDSGLDRSPCGTGTCAKAALMHAKGQLAINEVFVNQSIIGSLFTARIIEETKVGSLSAVIPEISGSAYIMGMNQLYIDQDDPLRDGFLLE
jgi:proline racemase